MHFYTDLPQPWWPVVVLAALLGSDVLMSLRPPKFIRDCLDGVRFPREWWWTLVVVKTVAVAGLVVGIWADGVALAATVGVIVYFLCAAAAHVRARFTKQEFWVNCLGFLAIAVLVLVFSFLV